MSSIVPVGAQPTPASLQPTKQDGDQPVQDAAVNRAVGRHGHGHHHHHRHVAAPAASSDSPAAQDAQQAEDAASPAAGIDLLA